MVSEKTIKQKKRERMVFVYCMYCRKPSRIADLWLKEGRYDVCKDPECKEAYRNERRIKLERSKKIQRRDSLGENNDDPTWMNGDC